MPPRAAAKAAAEKPVKKSEYLCSSITPDIGLNGNAYFLLFAAKSTGGGGAKKKLSAFNKFMVRFLGPPTENVFGF